jgi:hypothetical protein
MTSKNATRKPGTATVESQCSTCGHPLLVGHRTSTAPYYGPTSHDCCPSPFHTKESWKKAGYPGRIFYRNRFVW